jgi:hypothetical protein
VSRACEELERHERGNCEGRKSYTEREGGQELVALARQLQAVAARLADRGFVTLSGQHYSPSAIDLSV